MKLNEIYEKFHIDTTSSAGALFGLRNLYENQIAAYKAGKEEGSTNTKQGKAVIAEWTAYEVVHSFENITDLANEILEEEPKAIVNLVTAFEEYTKYLRETRNGLISQEAVKRGAKVELSGLLSKEDLRVVQEGLHAHFIMARLTDSVPENFPTKVLPKSGETVPLLSKLQGNEGTPPRSYIASTLIYRVDGKVCSPALLPITYGPALRVRNLWNLARDSGQKPGKGFTLVVEGHEVEVQVEGRGE